MDAVTNIIFALLSAALCDFETPAIILSDLLRDSGFLTKRTLFT